VTTQVFRLSYANAATAANMIKPVLSASGQVALTAPSINGIGSTPAQAGGNDHAAEDMLVITDYPENIDAARRVLAEVDHRPQQILLEATILRATLNEDNALGIDFTVLGGVDFASITNPLGANTTAGAALNGQILNNGAAAPIIDKGYGGAGTGMTSSLPQGGLHV